MTDHPIYVSITGLRLRSPLLAPMFWWYATPAMAAAQRAHGNLGADARTIDGVHHTLSFWRSREHMLAYLRDGAHARAMRVSAKLGDGRVLGFEAIEAPDWATAHARWQQEARTV